MQRLRLPDGGRFTTIDGLVSHYFVVTQGTNGRYTLVAGHRRLAALQWLAQHDTYPDRWYDIPAVVRTVEEDAGAGEVRARRGAARPVESDFQPTAGDSVPQVGGPPIAVQSLAVAALLQRARHPTVGARALRAALQHDLDALAALEAAA